MRLRSNLALTLYHISVECIRLTDLDTGLLLDLPSLEVLDLSANQINRLSRAPFQNQSRLTFLSLEHNSIRQPAKINKT